MRKFVNYFVLLSTACPTSLASEPNIRGGRSGVQTAPACGAAFGGIDNDQPEIKARQRHRARLDPNHNILRKISTTKNLPRSFVMGSEASERSEKNSITTSKATQRGTVTFPVDLYFKCSGRAALNFFFFVCPLRGAGPLSSRGVPVDCLTDT